MTIEIPLQPMSAEQIKQKYMSKDYNGKYLETTKEEVFERVSSILTNDLEKRKKFFRLMENGHMPGGRIPASLGCGKYKPKTSVINCVIAPEIDDSMKGIFDHLGKVALTLKATCGVGMDSSPLRPRGAFVEGVGAKTSGPVSFLRVYNVAADTIKAAGARRVALLVGMIIYHPDIEDFITCKRGNTDFANFNFSVLITDEFMEAVENDEDFELYFPASKLDEQNISNRPIKEKMWLGKTKQCAIYKTLKARYLYDLIMRSTYEFSDPGTLFIDTINKMNLNNLIEYITVSNPCAEEPMPPGNSCLLGAMNLLKYVINPFKEDAYFDFYKFEEDLYVAHEMLDCVVEFNNLPLKGQREQMLLKRRHGLGFYAFDTMLTLMGIEYGSKKSIILLEKIGRLMAKNSFLASNTVAKEKGIAPVFEDSKFLESYMNHPLFKQHDFSPQKMRDFETYGFRWTHGTTVAPTGTMAFAWGNNCSAGIEPTFDHHHYRMMIMPNKKVKALVEVFSYEYLLYQKMFGKTAVKDLPSYFTSAHKIDWRIHIEVQATAQKYIDSSISKTINVDSNIEYEDFKNIYKVAHKKGLKGITTFRSDPSQLEGIFLTKEKLLKMKFEIELEDGTIKTLNGLDEVEYDGEIMNIYCLFSAKKEKKYDNY